jgi:hypothetical protein
MASNFGFSVSSDNMFIGNKELRKQKLMHRRTFSLNSQQQLN